MCGGYTAYQESMFAAHESSGWLTIVPSKLKKIDLKEIIKLLICIMYEYNIKL